MTSHDELSPREMVVDNAGVKKIQMALRDRSSTKKPKKPKQ